MVPGDLLQTFLQRQLQFPIFEGTGKSPPGFGHAPWLTYLPKVFPPSSIKEVSRRLFWHNIKDFVPVSLRI